MQNILPQTTPFTVHGCSVKEGEGKSAYGKGDGLITISKKEIL